MRCQALAGLTRRQRLAARPAGIHIEYTWSHVTAGSSLCIGYAVAIRTLADGLYEHP